MLSEFAGCLSSVGFRGQGLEAQVVFGGGAYLQLLFQRGALERAEKAVGLDEADATFALREQMRRKALEVWAPEPGAGGAARTARCGARRPGGTRPRRGARGGAARAPGPGGSGAPQRDRRHGPFPSLRGALWAAFQQGL